MQRELALSLGSENVKCEVFVQSVGLTLSIIAHLWFVLWSVCLHVESISEMEIQFPLSFSARHSSSTSFFHLLRTTTQWQEGEWDGRMKCWRIFFLLRLLSPPTHIFADLNNSCWLSWWKEWFGGNLSLFSRKEENQEWKKNSMLKYVKSSFLTSLTVALAHSRWWNFMSDFCATKSFGDKRKKRTRGAPTSIRRVDNPPFSSCTLSLLVERWGKINFKFTSSSSFLLWAQGEWVSVRFLSSCQLTWARASSWEHHFLLNSVWVWASHEN